MRLKSVHTIEYVLKQVITQLAVKILFGDYSGFYDMRRTIILPEKQK